MRKASSSSGSSRGSNRGSSRKKSRGGSRAIAIIFIIVAIVLVVLIGMAMTSVSSGGIPNSTENRKKLTGTGSYDSDCVIDSLGWLNDVSKADRDLKSFYDQTGVQPYVVFLDYDASLSNEKKQEQYAQKWYEKNIDNENAFVYFYFGTDHEGTGKPGYMCHVMGKRVESVMDSEAVEIFWAYIDKNWYKKDLTENQVIVNSFNETAERIMTKNTSIADVLKWMVIAILVFGVLILIIRIINTRRRHQAEKAAETEQILNTPLEKSRDELLEKYLKDDQKR